jgi:SAM-dependent methyltransferase
VLHRPDPERSYMLTTRRGEEIERPLKLRPAPNAEIVVGDCCALPFPETLFDAVCSSNVIDIAGVEAPLGEAARVLRPTGALYLSDPFYFREGEAPAEEPKHAVRAEFQKLGLRIEREEDGVPWAWATYDRHWRLYFNYCAAARKTG